ncbi:MAG: hypothetical protein AMXMBFR48_23370 [Ignavibacteriales bacterium]|jgi:DnaJ-domain-containing protein 1
MFSVLDRSTYLKGLLVLAKKDNKLVETEKDIIRDIAQRFGFSKDFYEETMRGLMANKYIGEDPVTFSDSGIARMFLQDGLKLAFADDDFDLKELEWLRKTAEANKLEKDLFESFLEEFKAERIKQGKKISA